MPNRIVAVAIAAENKDITINSRRDLRDLRRVKTRPYLRGLVQGLATRGLKLRKDYVIEFRQRKPSALGTAAAFGNPATGDVIFCMSTTVVKAAADLFSTIPIVGVVSDPTKEANTAGTKFDQIANICGVSARRSQTAGDCFDRFLRTVPTLIEVKVLTKQLYGPSDRAFDLVNTAATQKGIACTPVPITDAASLETALDNLTVRDPDGPQPAMMGVLVLPIDVCLGHAQEIIDIAQGEKKIPVFFPVPDWVKPNASGALGAYGVSQQTCGEMMAERVSVIWRSGNAVPGSPFVRWVVAPDDTLQWVVSGAVADPDELNIPLSQNVPRI
jgi:ABC-type uncharacterized transport system substrate-binding protein